VVSCFSLSATGISQNMQFDLSEIKIERKLKEDAKTVEKLEKAVELVEKQLVNFKRKAGVSKLSKISGKT